MHFQESLKRVSDLASRRYITQADERLHFHNMAHTIRLLDAVGRMSAHYRLDDKNHFIVSAAAWMHDLGISGDMLTNPDNARPAYALLKEADLPDDLIQEIEHCTLAIHQKEEPASLNEKILSDAYHGYLGSPDFLLYNQLLKKETEARKQEKIKGSDWRAQTILRFGNHRFHTDYSRSLFDETKEVNLRSLFQLDRSSASANGHPAWKHKSRHHLSGVETVFRNSSTNHLNLSVMADNKAYIMIFVNSILISVGIGLIIGKFVLIPQFFIPTALLLLVNVFTIIYSVLATRPGIMKGKFTRESVDNKTVDLLFFGNFFKMPLEDFEYGMRKLMDDDDFLYGNLIRDIHSQGQNLGRKFRLLRTSYNLFMYGTALTVLAYIVSFFL